MHSGTQESTAPTGQLPKGASMFVVPTLVLGRGESEAAAMVAKLGCDVRTAGADPKVGPDSIYVRDAAVFTPKGAILCRMGKGARDHTWVMPRVRLRRVCVCARSHTHTHICMERTVCMRASTAALAMGRRVGLGAIA